MAALIEVENLVKHYQLGEVTVEALGGLIGIALARSSVALSYLAQWATLISGGAILLAFAVSGFVGVFFGYYPARKAAFLNPIEALRYE